MNFRLPLLVLIPILSLAAACQRIPPSVSIPGYEEKIDKEDQVESQPRGTSTNPPSFFPGSNPD